MDRTSQNEASSEISQLLVEQVAARTGMYIEGALSYVQVLDPDGIVRVEQRARGGNCGNLDPPTDHCGAEVAVSDAEERVAIRVTPGEGCTIDLDPPA